VTKENILEFLEQNKKKFLNKYQILLFLGHMQGMKSIKGVI
jgi:hypothetical protein